MGDGWVEVPALHGPTAQIRIDKKNFLRLSGTKRVRVELQQPDISGTPLASPSLPVNRLQQYSRSCLAPLNDPLKLPSSKGGLSTEIG